MWNSTMMKPCIAHLNQVMLFFGSFTIFLLSLFLLLRAVLMNHSFDIVRLKKKKMKKKKKKKKTKIKEIVSVSR